MPSSCFVDISRRYYYHFKIMIKRAWGGDMNIQGDRHLSANGLYQANQLRSSFFFFLFCTWQLGKHHTRFGHRNQTRRCSHVQYYVRSWSLRTSFQLKLKNHIYSGSSCIGLNINFGIFYNFGIKSFVILNSFCDIWDLDGQESS